MSNSKVTQRYYPKLSEVITVEDLPEFLSFVEDGLNGLLGSIHYKNLQPTKSFRGDSAAYSLDIISKNIGLDLPFGMRLVLNPDADGDTSISSFPVAVEFQWPILAFLRSFSLAGFSFTPEAFYELGLHIFKISEDQVLAHTLNYFVEPGENGESKFQVLIDDINSIYPDAALVLQENAEPTVSSVVALIKSNSHIPVGISALMFGAYILQSGLDETKAKLQQFYNLIVPGGIEEYIHNLIMPKFRAALTVSAAVEFPPTILKPVTANGVPIPNTKSLFKFAEATLYVDSEGGIGYEGELEGSLIPEYNQIGNTGLLIGFTGAKLDLSRKTNIAEADAAGYPVDFTGLYLKHASVTFGKFGADHPDHPSARIVADDLFLGTGGVSGTIAVENNGLLHRRFGENFDVQLDKFNIAFHMGTVTNCDIAGTLTIGSFKSGNQPATVGITAFIHENGDFNITAVPGTNFPPLSLPGVFDLKVRKFSLGKKERGYYIEVAGTLNFTAEFPLLGGKVLPKGIEITKFLIWDNGDLEFEAGTIQLGSTHKLKVGPVNMEVSKMSLGAYTRMHNNIERRYAFFGFDGMVNLGNAGISSTGNGIKYYFTIDNGEDKPFDHFLSIDRIAIDMTIPAHPGKDSAGNDKLPAFTLHGSLSMKNPDPGISGSNAGTEYSGTVTYTIPRLDLGGSAGMRLNPSIPAFVVDIGMQLAKPIYLGSTGLGIYEFRGLIGQHYLPAKSATTPPLPDTASWWEYYKAKSTETNREGIEIDKFAAKPGFSIGAGLSIATSFDGGVVFSSKLFLLLGLPEVFLLQGQAAILSSRIGLKDNNDPPFSALIAIDSTSFRGNFGVDYKLPSTGGSAGWIFSLKGNLDMAFFFNNASGWYLNVGTDQPATERVQARILTLFQGYAYLMISSRGFKAGAGARFDFNKKLGPVSVGFGASLDMGGFVSFKPVQIGAFISVGGYAYLKIAWFKIGLSVQIGLAVEAPRPFNIAGSIKLKIHTPWPLPDIKITLEMAWRFNNDRSLLLAPIPVIQTPDPEKGYLPAVAVNILSAETFPVNYVKQGLSGGSALIPPPGDSSWQYDFTQAEAVKNVTIPLDSFIDIELLKPVKPGNAPIGGAASQLPGGYSEMVPPQKGHSGQVRHEFELAGLDIYAWKPNGAGSGAWVPYQVYEAVSAIVAANTGPGAVDLSALKQGYWQFAEPGRYNKIRLLSQNMFSYAADTKTSRFDLDGLSFKSGGLFCYETVSHEHIINWQESETGAQFPAGTTAWQDGVILRFSGTAASIREQGGLKGLYATRGGAVSIILPEGASAVNIGFGANVNDVAVKLYRNRSIPNNWVGGRKLREYIETLHLAGSEQHTSLSYDDLEGAADEIEFVFGGLSPMHYDGILRWGKYYPLADAYAIQAAPAYRHLVDTGKTLLYAGLYARAFSPAALLAADLADASEASGLWRMDTVQDLAGGGLSMLNGSPEYAPGFVEKGPDGAFRSRSLLGFNGNTDGLSAAYAPQYQAENGSFSVSATAVFSPWDMGVFTLVQKVREDYATGRKKGFTVHVQQVLDDAPYAAYPDELPVFTVWVTLYNGQEQEGFPATCTYTSVCPSSVLAPLQYKHILVSADRELGTLDIFIDKLPAESYPLPAWFAPDTEEEHGTLIEQVSYFTESLERRKAENAATLEAFIDETEVLNANLNKTIQPVWRPDTTFAVAVRTRDLVDGNAGNSPVKTQVFGFRTAGPVGHFHEQNKAYTDLSGQDRSGELQLANLRSYIDYERSFPDAQSRFDLSKPVFYEQGRVGLVFTKPYLNAMYANWDSYQGLPAVQSSLEVQVLGPDGIAKSASLAEEHLPEIPVTALNYTSLPPDLQQLFLLSQTASEDGCNVNPVNVSRKISRNAYLFTDLLPETLYTAIFNAAYRPGGAPEAKSAEVHRFSFKTSRFASFSEQVDSIVLDSAATPPLMAVYPLRTAFTPEEITEVLLPLADEAVDNDPAVVLNYAVRYDRMVFGGLQLKNLESAPHTVVNLVLNRQADNDAPRILGILLRNPEPFNDPKLPAASLAGTVQLTVTGTDSTIEPEAFTYIHSRDTSAVFISNAAMDIPRGTATLALRYKLFNGHNYESLYEDRACPPIELGAYLG